MQAGLGQEAPLARARVLRRDDLLFVSRDDAAAGAAGYREAVNTILGRLRRPRIIGWGAKRKQVAAAEERATAEERARIAYELHDVVAHSISEMVVQASGVRYLL